MGSLVQWAWHALRAYRLRRDIRKLRAIFARNGKSESMAVCDALEAELRRRGDL